MEFKQRKRYFLVKSVNNYKDSEAATKSQDEMEGALLLDVVVLEGSAVLELFSGEDESLLVWGNSLLVLNLCFHILDGVRGLDIESDGLAGEGLHKDLHASSESQHEMEGTFFLDVVILEGSAVFELLSGEDESLLVWGDAFFVLDLGLDILNGVRRLNVEGDSLASKGLDKDLHATSESENKMEGALLLDVVILESSAVFELLASEDESLLVWGDALLVLDLCLDVFDGVRGLNIQSDGFSGESFNENLHFV